MASRSFLAQDDFSSLGIAYGQDAESQLLEYHHGLKSVERSASGDSGSACEADEIYRPVNFIPDEVYKLIQNWELSHLKQQESAQAVDSMETESFTIPLPGESIFEPMRCMLESAHPPKRFYLTFWRSITWRIFQRKKESTKRDALDRAAMFSSDLSDEE
jgi:hypothetical protein